MQNNPFATPTENPRDNVTRIEMREDIAHAFRQHCDGAGFPWANRRLEELIVTWNVRGRPDNIHLIPPPPPDVSYGTSQFTIHAGFAAMVKPWARLHHYRLHAAFDSIVCEYLSENDPLFCQSYPNVRENLVDHPR